MSVLAFAGLLIQPAIVAAEPSSRPEIVIGMSLPLSGFNAGAGAEGLAVVKAYFDSINKSGGIAGRKLAVVALDDQFSPAKAVENAHKLIDDGVVAIFNCWGTSSCSAMMPVISAAEIPMVAGIAGGGPMRNQPGRFAFNVRADTVHEIGAMVNQMKAIGQDHIALVYQDDPFGKSGQAAAATVFAKARVEPVAELSIRADAADAQAVVERLKKLPRVDGVILVAAPPATVKLIPLARRSELNVQFYNLAAQANVKVAADLGKDTAGVVFTTLVPSPWSPRYPVVEKYQQIVSAASGKRAFSYLGLEVFINAEVLVEGLRGAGPNVTRESLVRALEAKGEMRFGPMTVRYGPAERAGSGYVGLTMIDRDGRFIE